MKYDELTASYWHEQIERVEALRLRINDRMKTPSTGRTIPDDSSLAIGSGRRLNLAVLFLDICSYSARPCYTADEQDLVLRVLNLFFTEMIRIAEDYGGVVEKNTGDGLLAYFEDLAGTTPVPAAKRAVASSLTMFAANDILITDVLRRSGVPDISMRISIDYGPLTIARLGAAKRFNSIVAIGAHANFAAKMLRYARANEVVLGEAAKLSLPPISQALNTELALAETGWTYSLSGLPYCLYRYTDRWSRLG